MTRFRLSILASALFALAACDEAAAPKGTPGDLSVRAYIDRNASGSFEAGVDSALVGVIVTARASVDGVVSETPVSATTNASGLANFTDLEPGSYVLAVTGGQPAGAVLTTNPTPTVGVSFQGVVSGSTEFRYSFFPGSVTGRIFRDDDNSGGFTTGDVVGAGLTVRLRADTGQAGAVLATTTTDATGSFTFGLLAPGSYFVELENPTTISFGAAGAMRRVVVAPQGVISIPAVFTGSLVIPIAEARTKAVGTVVAVVGRLTVAPGSFTVASGGVNGVNSEIWVQDATGGIAVFSVPTANAEGLALGDSVQVSGGIGNFGGQVQISSGTIVTRRAAGAPPAPRVVTGAQLIARTFEGQLVRLPVITVTAVQTGTASSFNVTGTTEDGQVIVVRVTGPTTSGVIVPNTALTRADFVVGTRYSITGIATINITNPTPPAQPVTTIQIKPRMRSDVTAAPVTAPARVIINEVMANPSTTTDPAGEYVELYNAGGTAQDLTGWRFNDFTGAGAIGGVDTIGTSSPTPTPLVIQPGQYLLLVHTTTSTTGPLAGANYRYKSTINLNNTGTERLVLRNSLGETVDSVTYTTTGFPAGIARGVINPIIDNTDVLGANWTDQTTVFAAGTVPDRGTPGARNDGAVIPAPALLRADAPAATRTTPTPRNASATRRR